MGFVLTRDLVALDALVRFVDLTAARTRGITRRRGWNMLISSFTAGVMKRPGLRHPDMNNSTPADTTQVQTTRLSIGGMCCGACVRHVTRALDGMTGVLHVSVDLKANQATVEHLPDEADDKGLVAAIEAAGYTARVDATSVGASGRESTAVSRSTGCCCG